jgi:hypothetical protein
MMTTSPGLSFVTRRMTGAAKQAAPLAASRGSDLTPSLHGRCSEDSVRAGNPRTDRPGTGVFGDRAGGHLRRRRFHTRSVPRPWRKSLRRDFVVYFFDELKGLACTRGASNRGCQPADPASRSTKSEQLSLLGPVNRQPWSQPHQRHRVELGRVATIDNRGGYIGGQPGQVGGAGMRSVLGVHLLAVGQLDNEAFQPGPIQRLSILVENPEAPDVASRTLSGTQAGLPQRAGSVRARERRWPARRCGGGHTTVRRLPDDIPPLPSSMARRQNARRLCRQGANGQALAYLYSRDNDAEARQAKVLTKDEARRIAINMARLPELFGKADRD